MKFPHGFEFWFFLGGVLRHPPIWSFGHLVKMARNVDMISSIFDHKICFFWSWSKKKVVVILVSNDKKRVMLTLTKEVADDLEKKAKSMGLSKSALITSWINENRKEFEQKK
ncbi:CopG family transcriptional regulator [Enterococcus sp. C61]|uniref:CopG family transcriptional regulator n=1 Tax=Enterococcus sp. C61 TaxID=3231322 RepID=UPI0034A096F0